MRRLARRRLVRLARRLLGLLAVGAIGLGLIGYVTQQRSDARILAENPPPGRFIDVGGHRLHYEIAGAGGVTFVLEAGAGEYGGSWGGLADSLARIGRVFSYDRAGLGYSEPGPRPRTVQAVVRELHALLERAAILPPYVFVGHSLGGAIATWYAVQHPGEVAALLLIDPSHRDQVEALPAPPAAARWALSWIPRTARIGLAGRIFRPGDPIKRRSTHLEAYGDEIRALERSFELWKRDRVALGDVPLYVLTAGSARHMPGRTDEERRAAWATWRGLHADLVGESSHTIRRHVVVPGAPHYIHRAQPGRVAGLARELVRRLGSATTTETGG